MIKVQFGSGENKLEGWNNLQEHEADITKPLGFNDGVIDYIFAEHVVEHVTPQQAWGFFEECYRVLKPNGVARIIVPDVSKILHLADNKYFAFIEGQIDKWWKNAGLVWEGKSITVKDAIKTILFCHGHQAAWNVDTLKDVLTAIGFRVDICEYGKSSHPELDGIDSHWKLMGFDICAMESSVVEATK